MPKLTITQAHSLTLAEVKQRLQTLADRLGTKYGISARWTSETQATVSRTGVSGSITIAGALVTVVLDLNFIMTPLKDRVQARVTDELRQALAGPAS